MDYYLISTEQELPYAPRACQVVGRLRSTLRDDMAVAEVAPPFEEGVYQVPGGISRLVLASRFQGSSLFPVAEWPTYVYICRTKELPVPLSGRIDPHDIVILDWGAVYPSEASARAAADAMRPKV